MELEFIHVHSAMGMPGSETALEELMCRILGDLLEEGVVAKIADDLYCGGNSVEELLHNWKRVLQALSKCDLKLSASKTVINPQSTTILGWSWSSGTLQASPHHVAALTSCTVPSIVGRMKSFIGAYKVLSHVIPHCSSLIAHLDNATTGRQSQKEITWSDDLHTSFCQCQTALSASRFITLLQPDDQLWIITDGAVKLLESLRPFTSLVMTSCISPDVLVQNFEVVRLPCCPTKLKPCLLPLL